MKCRWLIRRDMPSVLQIARLRDGKAAWDREKFVAELSQRNCIGMVVERKEECESGDSMVVGYVIYTTHQRCISIIALGVHPEFDGSYAVALLNRIKGKLGQQHRDWIVAHVAEDDDWRREVLSEAGFNSRLVRGDGEGDVIRFSLLRDGATVQGEC